MVFPLFSGQVSPIVVDFGASTVKFLQVVGGGVPSLTAAAELPIPEDVRLEPAARDRYVADRLAAVLRSRPFRGRRVVFAPRAESVFIQHLQLTPAEGVDAGEQVRVQLLTKLGGSQADLVVRHWQVAECPRDGQVRHEHLGIAIPRDEVMRIVELFRRLRLQVVGVHDGVQSMVRAFDHLHRREGDQDRRTMYVDLGWSHTRVAIAHGTRLVFAKSIPMGGRHLASPSAAAEAVETTPEPEISIGARARDALRGRGPTASLSLAEDRRGRSQPAALGRPLEPAAPSLGSAEALEGLGHELAMCVRYYQSIFPDRPIERSIFVGGEARRTELCQSIARVLRLPAQLGDPIARLAGLDRSGLPAGPHPGWAVACGLCTAPVDL